MRRLFQYVAYLFSVKKSVRVEDVPSNQRNKSYFEADTLDDLLSDVYRALCDETSQPSATRGSFVELTGCMLVLNNPRSRLSRSDNRGKLFSALAELLWYLTKENRLEFMEYYLKGVYTEESDDGETVRSAYGERLFGFNNINQVENVIGLLLKGRGTSRRAVIQLFDASDISKQYKSIPCTCTLQFIARDKKLHMMVNMRSNDAFKGLPHDVFSFTMLQEIIARAVGLDIGVYKHCVGSLHLYTNSEEGPSDKERVLSYLDEGYFKTVPMPPMPTGDPWPAIQQLMQLEESVRVKGELLSDDLCGSDYWNDLCRLLLFYYHYKNAKLNDSDHLDKCKEIKAQMISKAFDIFLVSKIDSLQKAKA